MNYKEKVLKHYNIELTEDSWHNGCSLSVYRNLTSDGYDIWMINPEGGLETEHNIDWEQDAFMYKDNLPSVLFDIMINENKGIEQIWYIEDVDEIFEDYEWVEEWEKILRDLGDESIDDEDISGVELLLKLADEKHKK